MGDNTGEARATLLIHEVVPLDLRNAAREGGTGVGTPGTGVGETGDPSYTLTAANRAVPGVIAFSHTAGIDLQPSEHVTPTVLAGNDRMPAVSGHAVVRRLTPLECERLQGFPDGHTDVPGATDSARYKQCGNAVTVDVFDWVMARLVAVDEAAEQT